MFKKIILTILILSAFVFAKPSVHLDQTFSNGAIQISIYTPLSGKEDWIAVYPKGSSNAWENVITWEWVKDLPKNSANKWALYQAPTNIKKLGEYQVRYFENNSFTTYKALDFSIKKEKSDINLDEISASYYHTYLNFGLKGFQNKKLKPNPKDWIGFYKKNDSNAWGNVITWVWVRDIIDDQFPGDGDIELTLSQREIYLQNGEYEMRYFLNNSFTTYKKSSFKVKKDD